jgi:hypothetical protein
MTAAAVSELITTPDPQVIPRALTETEKAKRALQRRYKALYGFKPTGMTLENLSALVRRAERANGIVPEEEVPAQVADIQKLAEKFRTR